MDESAKLLLTVAIPTVTVLVGILVNNRQLDQLQRHVDQQVVSIRNEIASLRNEMNARFQAVDARFQAVDARFEAAYQQLLRVEGVLDARLKHLEER